LAALHTRASRFTEAAVCCRTLESIYHDAGYPDEATRYGALAAKYEERSGAVPAEAGLPAAIYLEPKVTVSEALVADAAPVEPLAPAKATAVAAESSPSFHVPAVSPAASKAQEPAEFEISSAGTPEKEIDLSAEWEGSLSDEPAASAPSEDTVGVAARGEEENPTDLDAIKEAVKKNRF
jgi:hypothetical protein